MANPLPEQKSPGITINKSYYSGAQASVFIGNVWVDDITSINFSFTDGKKPIYGYGSEYFDFVSSGQKIVQGSFTINFREPNYIWLMLKKFEQLSSRPRSLTDLSKETAGDADLEDAIAFNTSINDKRKNYDLFFGADRPDAVKEMFVASNRIGEQGFFSGQQSNNKVNHLGFDILMGYGYELNSETIGEKIVNAHIVGRAKAVAQDGRPIQEEYQFFARDLQ